MKKNKIRTISAVFSIVLILILLIGATYAYLMAQVGTGSSTEINITADTIDSLQFSTGSEISLTATQFNFGEGAANQKGSTTAKATLIAGTDRTPTYNYNVYLNIAANGITYTKDTSTPELILKVTKKGSNGVTEEITNISGLTYNETLGGFDITTKKGQIIIASNNPITTATTEVQTWNIEVTFRNLDSNQAANAGKMFRAEALIEKEESEFIPTLADVCRNGDNLANCIKAYADSNDYEVTKIIKHDSSQTYGAEDDNYRYSGANYALTEKASAYSNVNDTSSTANGVIKMYCSRGTSYSYVDNTNCTSSYTRFYYLAYDSGKTRYTNYFDAAEKAVADGYLKGNVNNYICFGSDAETCENDNLYRIIGVFGSQVKLIKYDYANSNMLGTDGDYTTSTYSKSSYSTYKGSLTTINGYYFNYNGLPNHTGDNQYGSNNWETSLLNITNLNTNYITYLNNRNAKWVQMIADTNWNIGGYNTSNVTAKTFYNAEITNQTSETSKIGLMQVSDYGYARLPSNWNTNLYNYNTTTISDNNWMYMGLYEWTISPHSSYSSHVYYVDSSGNLVANPANSGYAARPVLHLNAAVIYVKGNGTISDPYRIN